MLNLHQVKGMSSVSAGKEKPTTNFEVLPKHIAIVMDGNGRWAKQKSLPRFSGHRAGVQTSRLVVDLCQKLTIPALTLFAFSSENWFRPKQEVNFLMNLFKSSLTNEANRLKENNICLKIVGSREKLPFSLCEEIDRVEKVTATNTGLKLNLAINYGGRWDIVQAAKKCALDVADGKMHIDDINESTFTNKLCFADCPPPDLVIRTGLEQRLSNFLLYQLAYAEMVFLNVFWPEVNEKIFLDAIATYQTRQRRFGLIEEQLTNA